MDFVTPHFWVALGEIMVVNILLSGDNAVVIALACRNLPKRYRNRAVLAGSGGAVLLRVLFCFVVAWLMQVPFLKLAGGALLLWIGIRLLVPEHEDGDGAGHGASNLWGAIRTIVIADAVMSLDNVIAIAAAAKGDMTLIITGLVLSIPLIVFGSQLLLGVLNRFPVLVTAGGALLGWIGGEVMVTDPALHGWVEGLGHNAELAAALAGAAVVVLVGKTLARRAEARARLEDLTVENTE